MKVTRETGHGVYLFEQADSAKMPCWPREVDPKVNGVLGDGYKEHAASLIIGHSKRHSAWCGIDGQVFYYDLQKNYNAKECEEIRHAIKQMIRDGLLVLANQRTGALSFLNRFNKDIICPTPKLVRLFATKPLPLPR